MTLVNYDSEYVQNMNIGICLLKAVERIDYLCQKKCSKMGPVCTYGLTLLFSSWALVFISMRRPMISKQLKDYKPALNDDNITTMYLMGRDSLHNPVGGNACS